MVAAVPATAAAPAASHARIPKNPSPSPRRRPLTPSEKDNAAFLRRPKPKDITSRYLASPSSSSSSKSVSSTTSTSSASSAAAAPSPRRFASPLPAQRSSAAAPKRSQSVDRTRPTATTHNAHNAAEVSSAAKAICTTTRSLSVSFQGESFFYQTSKVKPASPSPSRRSTSRSEKARLPEQQHHHRWPSSKTQQPNPLTQSLDCSLVKKGPILAAVKSLRQSMVIDEGVRRASFDGAEFLMSSDTDSASSGSNSGSLDYGIPPRMRTTHKGISVPARFLQETVSQPRRLLEPGTPLPSLASRATASPRTVPAKKSLLNGSISSPLASSPLNAPVRAASPSKLGPTPSRRIPSPAKMRSGTSASSSSCEQHGQTSSIPCLAIDTRRRRNGISRIEEEHLLRLLYNRHLQWWCVNARADVALLAQTQAAEKYMHDAWIITSEMRDSVMCKRRELQVLTNNSKLITILQGQIAHLEEWSLVDREYVNSLSGAIDVLRASTLSLPVTEGAKASVQDVKNSVGSAVDLMQTLGSSMCTLLSKVAGASVLVSELAKVAGRERSLMEQCRELLSTLASLHVKYWSLQGNRLQLTRGDGQAQH